MEITNEKKEFLRNFIWNSLGTGINSFNSLFFLIIVTRINGIEIAGIFSIAYATATILYTLAMYSGRLCQVTDIENRIKDKDYITNRALTCFIMIIGAICFLLIKRYSAFKTTIFALLAIFKAIESFSDILYGVMQKNNLLYKSGMSLSLKGFIGIILFLLYSSTNLLVARINASYISFISLSLWYLEFTSAVLNTAYPCCLLT